MLPKASPKKTRRNKAIENNNKPSKVHTIPQLRKAFEEIDRFVHTKHPSTKEFQAKWKEIFGKEVLTESAEDYLSFVRESVKTTMQKGGAAPLNYDMRAGADIPYGNFPPYISSGFVNPEDSFLTSKQLTPADPSPAQATLLKGGARKTRKARKNKKGAFALQSGALAPQSGGGIGSMFGEAMTRLFPASSPPSLGQETQMDLKGAPISVSGDPTNNPLKYVPNGGASQSVNALDVSRPV